MSNPPATLLSTKEIPPEERLIFALDVPDADEARRLVETLGTREFYKIGLELFAAGGYLELHRLAGRAGQEGLRGPQALRRARDGASAVRNLRRPRRHLHHRPWQRRHPGGRLPGGGGPEDPRRDRAHQPRPGGPRRPRLRGRRRPARPLPRPPRPGDRLRRRGLLRPGSPGAAGELGEKLLIVTPGIRPVENRPADDQKRVVTVEEAIRNGADYVVVGRPIRNAPDPFQAAMEIQGTIQGLFVGG